MTSSLFNNRYQILQTLGAGGFGTTFLAEDTQMPSHRRCVIKQLKPITSNPAVYALVQERFKREAAILEELGDGHPQIPRLYAYLEEAGEFFLIQEWIEGVTLRELVQAQGTLTEATVKQVLIDILPVLSYVHSNHIIHRDIKPDNIILRKRDNKPVLIDFGAVRETMGTVMNSQGESTSSIVIGTPGFMPSEQAAGRPLYSSDLYSLGLTMIYLLSGKTPQELQLDPQTGDVIWRRYAPDATMDFAAIIDKSIQYHPRDRYPTAQEMLSALHGIASGGVLAASTETIAIPGLAPTVTIQPDARSATPSTSSPQAEVPATILDQADSDSSGDRYLAGAIVQGEFHLSPSATTANSIPDEVPGWNWGAFLLPGLWCVNNQVWIGLLSWSGFVTWMLGWLAGGFVLGAKGNEWAWKSRRWRGIEEFKRNQRHWAIGGFLTWGGFIGLIVAAGIYGSQLPDDSGSESSSRSNDNSSTNATIDSPTTGPGTAPDITVNDPFAGAASSTTGGSGQSPKANAPIANPYPVVEVRAYLDNCIASAQQAGATPEQAESYCQCTLDRFQTTYSFEEFQDIVLEYQQTKELPPEFADVINACNS